MSILKQGEINAIMNNFEVVKNNGKLEGRMGNNSIHLASSHENRVSLRTNGLVVYGVYYHGEEKIRFTHDFRKFPEPFVKCDNYADLKKVVLNAWKKTFDEKAQAKLEEVKVLVQQLLTKQQETIAKYNAQQEPTTPQIHTNTIEKEEVKEMNKNTKIENKIEVNELNVMNVAHLIRRELKLEGHYHVQMKIALTFAWKVKKGEMTLDALLSNTTTDSAEKVVTETTSKEAVTKVVEEKVAETQPSYRLGISSYKDGVVTLMYTRNDGAQSVCIKKKAGSIDEFDQFLAGVGQPSCPLINLVKVAPANTVIEYYGMYTQAVLQSNEELMALVKSKNISFIFSVAPSGDVA